MKRFTMFACLALALVFALSATAGDLPRYSKSTGNETFTSSGSATSKASRDSFLLMGGTGRGAPYNGDFEDQAKTLGAPVNGWTSIDDTEATESHWHVSDYFAVAGMYSMWCGDLAIPSCDDGVTDPDGGYGPNWNDLIEWRQAVNQPSQTTTLTITATANIFSEGGYDGTTLQAEKFDVGFVDINYWDGLIPALAISEAVTYLPGEYMGDGGDEVVIVWHFMSDGAWDDMDCSFPTSGAIQLDDVAITSDNGAGMPLHDFEDQLPGDWVTRFPVAVGDFAKIWTGLEDGDPCATNFSRQIAFIDDGVVVPGTGGTLCQDFCYGPNGFIVNNNGGLAGPDAHINSAIHSPVMAWPDATHRGALLVFGVFRHEGLLDDSAGIFYTWHVRSSVVEADIYTAPWENRNFVQYGGPEYFNHPQIVDDLLVTGRNFVQIRLACYEYGWVWGWNGSNGSPAPYFDHIRFTTYPIVGPGQSTREIDIANDCFPENGTIDMATPEDLWCRFDMAQNIAAPSHLRRDFGDSVAFDAVTSRAGAVLDGVPEVVYTVRTNPLFDPYRTNNTPYTGRLDCGLVTGPAGAVVPDRFWADLPDTGWLFPGDVVHYYIETSDIHTVDLTVETSTLPANIEGFGNFDNPMGFNPAWVVRCLPNITSLAGAQPPIIFWNDFGNRGGMNEWFTSFNQLGLVEGRHFDHFFTNGPSSGVGNGLGGKATPEQLAGYETLLYTAGDLGVNTLSNGDLNVDSGEDVQTVSAWLNSGNKNAYMTGDDLAMDLDQAGLLTGAFLSDMMNVTHNAQAITDLIGGQTAPRVLITPANPVFTSVSSWIAYGGCRVINTFDAVTAVNLGTRIALFANTAGDDGGWVYSACTIASGVGDAGTSEVISMPYDFMFIYTDPTEVSKINATLAARVRVLRDILFRFGIEGDPIEVSGANAPALQLSARNYPNPFNPTTTIKFVAPRTGELSMKVYNVRGELVRTLINGTVEQGENSIDWNGKDNRGSQVASGVYFYEVRMGNDVQVNKMALVK